ncbi:MAG: hypothetical protein NT099_08470 [Candidatus Saganbacteria bacterium]|nr:hypothetical protein [Candidatus Saganbacteria bacterium]
MTLLKLLRNPKVILGLLIILVGGVFLISKAFPKSDIGDLLPPEEAQRYTYANYSGTDGYYLAKIDLANDSIIKKYNCPEDVRPSTIDKNGNLYLQNFSNLWSRDKVFAFYPKREKLKRIVKSKGLSLLKVFAYKDKLYVLCTDQRDGQGELSKRGSSLEIFDLATKKRIKTLFLGKYGTTAKDDIWVSHKDGLFIAFASDMQIQQVIKGTINETDRLSLYVIDLNANTQIADVNLDEYAMGCARTTYGQKRIFFNRYVDKYYPREHEYYKKHDINSLMQYSLANNTLSEFRRFNNKDEVYSALCFNNNKLYSAVWISDKIGALRILDPNTNKTIKEIPFWSISEIIRVGNNKLYLNAMKTKEESSQGIYVFDTKTDQVTKFIPGNFLYIAENAWFY